MGCVAGAGRGPNVGARRCRRPAGCGDAGMSIEDRPLERVPRAGEGPPIGTGGPLGRSPRRHPEGEMEVGVVGTVGRAP